MSNGMEITVRCSNASSWQSAYEALILDAQVATLAKSLVKAGRLGSEALPPVALSKTVGKEGAKYTLIENAGALGLAKYED